MVANRKAIARRFIYGGALMMLVGAAIAARSGLFMLRSVATPGVITDFVPQPVGHHAFRVRYEAGGRQYDLLTGSYSGELSAGNTEFVVGQRLTVRYRPEAPSEARIYALREQLGPAAFFLLPGLGLLLYGLFPEGATAGPLVEASAPRSKPGRRSRR